MKRIVAPIFVLLASILTGHFVTLHMTPVAIMKNAIERLEERGVALHEFNLAPRTTPQTQTVVRPSPDLVYSICPFDLSGNQVLAVRVGPYDDYSSVSFFDIRTNNFATVRIDVGGDPASGSEIVLRAPGRAALDPLMFSGPQIEAPTRRGLILIRRLAPTQAAYHEVVSTAADDSCSLLIL
ncbi:MAG: DUF1254 domain-containing protein [Marinicaulis sp.]|nr:DUF1254 domain-containing protein [Marinicaulis sp.]NNE39368.1 DUF1254 domain-containing protein [Marinicaulis sp.]NNL88625.1 DUF1254 domain-containing protein [Marinicaulis sp.]